MTVDPWALWELHNGQPCETCGVTEPPPKVLSTQHREGEPITETVEHWDGTREVRYYEPVEVTTWSGSEPVYLPGRRIR